MMSDVENANPLAGAATVEQPAKRGPGRPPLPKPTPAAEPIGESGIVIHDAPTKLAGQSTPDFGTKEYAEYVARVRDQRKPFGEFLQKLARPARAGYYRVWINDEPGRINQARNAGYEHVKDQATGKNEVLNVNPHTATATQLAYLMEIPLEIWELDQKAKHRRADEIEAGIKGSKVIAASAQEAKEDGGAFYVPGGGSKVEHIGKGRV